MLYNFEHDFNDKVIGVEVEYSVETQVNKFGVEHDTDVYHDIDIESIDSDDDEFNSYLNSGGNYEPFVDWVKTRKFDELIEYFIDRE